MMMCVFAHPCCVGSLGVVLQHAGHAKIGHLTDQVAVDQDVARRQVPVHVAHLRQVLHARGDATQHANQLDRGELPIIQLGRKGEREGVSEKVTRGEKNSGSQKRGEKKVWNM